MALTPEEKLANKQRVNLRIIHNGIKMDFSMKKIPDWHTLYARLGYSPEDIKKFGNKELTYEELKSFLQKQSDELECRLKGKQEGSHEAVAIVQPSLGERTKEAQPTVQAVEIKVEGLKDIPFKLVDRPSGVSDFNDCTVLAFSTATGIEYEKARNALTEEGRKYGAGLRTDWLSEFLLSVGFQLVNTDTRIPIRKALESCNIGKYICLVKDRRHALAVIDGVVHDWEKPSDDTLVERIYKLVPKEIVKKVPLEVVHHDAKDDYGFKYSPNENFFAYWFQKKAIAELENKIFVKKHRGVLLLSATGTGKTFILLALLRRAFDRQWHENKTFSHIPYLYITKSTILEQTGRVAEKCFNIKPNVDLEIINIEQLRSKDGQYWVKEECTVVGGKEVTKWVWKKNIQPCIVGFDESQGAKHAKKSKQGKIIAAYNDLPNNTCLVSVSATPFVRVSEAQTFAVSTHRPLEHLGFPPGTKLTNENWNAYASIISSPAKPEDYNQASIERLMKDLEDYIVRVRGVKPQFEAINGVKVIDFESYEKKQFYEKAWDRFLEEKKKIDDAKEAGDSAGVCYLVILLKFAMAAELCHAEHFAKDMYEAVKSRGKAAVAAVKFKQTLIEIVKILNEKYGVSRDEISLVWGGGQTQLTAKQKAKAKVKSLSDKFKSLGIEMDELLSDTGLDDVEDRVLVELPEHLRLGAQDQNERQKEIDRFQSGKSLYCIYTLKSGGVGLSLHHTDELTSFKCRRKESGYAVEEDIPKVPVRPRETFVVVTYNAIELVQGVGRVPRLTSLSETIQNVYCYAGTVEVDMGRIYSQKLRCLSSVVKQKETWQDVIFGGASRSKVVDEVLKKSEGLEADESTMIDEGDVEDEEENGNGDSK